MFDDKKSFQGFGSTHPFEPAGEQYMERVNTLYPLSQSVSSRWILEGTNGSIKDSKLDVGQGMKIMTAKPSDKGQSSKTAQGGSGLFSRSVGGLFKK